MSPILMTMLMAMVPVVELRGAIPMGVSMDLPVWKVLLASVIGNMIPVPFIVLFVRKVFDRRAGQAGALAGGSGPEKGRGFRSVPADGSVHSSGNPASGDRCVDGLAGGGAV